jgi:hypothetical protein
MIARVLGVLLLAGGSLLMIPFEVASAATVNIAVSSGVFDTWFCNSSYQNGTCPTAISVGDEVVWTFNGFYPHTTTECGGDSNCDNANPTPLWDSGSLSNGQTYSRVFNTPGVYLYQCNIHGSGMRGQITVAGAGVGGETQLANIGAGVTSPPSAGAWYSVWVGVGAVAAGMIILTGSAWVARRLASREA